MGGAAMRLTAVYVVCLAGCLAGCFDSEPVPAEQVRPVKAIVVQSRAIGNSITLTGHIVPQELISLSFRLDGKLIERPVNTGDVVAPGQLIARLDSQIQVNTQRAAEADLTAAK